MRWIVRGLSAVVALVALALVALWLVPAETVARLAAAEFQRMTGRALTIEGPVKATLWPALGVRTGPVGIANAPWSQEGPMLAARSLEVRLDLGAALSGRLVVEAATFDGLRLVLERAADGQVNWALPAAEAPAGVQAAAPAAAPAGLPLTLTQGRLNDAEILWLDHAAGSRLALRGIEAELRLPETAGPLTLTAAGMLDDTPLRLALEAAEAAALAAGQVVGLKLELAAGGSTLTFEGRAGVAPASAEGSLRVDLADLRALADLAGTAPPDLPEGLGRRARQLAGQVTLAPEGTLHLRQGELVLDANRLGLAGDVSFDGPRPKLVAQLEAGALSVPGLAPRPAAEAGPAAAPADAGWSRAPLDASALALADAEVALRATSVDLGLAQLGTARLMLTVDRARAVIEARELRAWDGLITGQFVVNNRSGLSVGGDLSLAGIASGPMLGQLAGWDRLLSQGDLHLKFLGVGQSVAAIMASLSGEGRFALGKGELRGLDLAGMLRTLDTGYVGEGQKTIFDGLSASFRINAGDLATEDLRLAAPWLTATGRGTVGLGAQVMDLRITPVALANPDGSGGLRVPLEISGPWSAPRFRLDLKALADQELAEEKARLEAAAKDAEARAKAEAERRAAEELGIERREGESFEDAAKRRAQEALDAEAGRVLDRLLRRGE